MSKILILSSYYLGVSTANGICAKNIAKQLKKNGHDVFVVCYNKGEAEENVYTVSCPVHNSEKSLASRIYRGIRAIFKPTLNHFLINEYVEKSLNICKNKKIDVVVGMFFPFETVSAVTSIKKHFPWIRTIIYELDSVGDGIFSISKYQILVNYSIERWLRKQYRYADSIIVMESHNDYWKNSFSKKYGNKLILADIPVLVEKKFPQVKKSDNEPVSFLYGGLLEQAYRSPDCLLSIFEEYYKYEQATLDFFSKGDCEVKISDIAKRVPGIHQNGYVSEKMLNEAVIRADILISIGNRVSKSLPSKLITYFSYGKPVVHISLQKDDVCIKYLKQYPLSLILYECDSIEENVKKLRQFIKKNRNNMVKFSDLENSLTKNSPCYSAQLITNDCFDSKLNDFLDK